VYPPASADGVIPPSYASQEPLMGPLSELLVKGDTPLELISHLDMEVNSDSIEFIITKGLEKYFI